MNSLRLMKHLILVVSNTDRTELVKSIKDRENHTRWTSPHGLFLYNLGSPFGFQLHSLKAFTIINIA